MSLPLAGVRVVEIANYVAVPAAGALLADLGAEVVKIETPPRGELYRRSRPRYAGYACEFDENPPFHMDNRGKRSLMLDLGREEARGALLRLVDRAEIVITNLLPARRKKYGVDHTALLARVPRLIVGAINGYGGGGDEADRPAFDYAAYWARTGMMDVMHDEGVAPSLQRPAVGDHAAGVNLVCGILAAMRLRDADGRGRYVEVSLLQTGLHILGTDVANALVTRAPAKRHDRNAPPNPLWNSYPTADGRWLLLVMVDPEPYWPKLCRGIGRPELESDERFADGFKRAANATALVRELEAVFAARSLAAWRPLLDAAGLIWAPVQRVDEAIDDPQVRAMGYVYEIDHPTAGRFETVGPPFRIEGETLGARHAASPLHADAAEVLREAGLSEAEIAKLA
jgi:crotonobetainyl-CoA:carnitine CoA-transferase CaiB-like acyl-CoA transferase